MTAVLVTGGTGHLGRPTVEKLRADGHEVRVLSRHGGADPSTGERATGELATNDVRTGDLRTGAGIRDALHGMHTVVHLATGRDDVTAAKNLFAAARSADVQHVVLISIVGVDRIPLAYYRGKVAIERMLADSGLPYTVQRATQFHYLVEFMFQAQRFLPVIVAPSVSFQPIDTHDVANRLAELTRGAPRGRVDDIGGPETLTARELAERWALARESRRRIWPLGLPGKTFAALAAGNNLVEGEPYGRITFGQYLASDETAR